MSTFWFAYLLAYSFDGDQFSVAGNTPDKAGVEVRIIEALGPQGLTKAECEAYANSRRPIAAAAWKLDDFRRLKYVCVAQQMPNK